MINQNGRISKDQSGLIANVEAAEGVDEAAFEAHDHSGAVHHGPQLTLATAVAAGNKTGSGKIVGQDSPTIVTPTIASQVNANHNHADAAGGGQLGDSGIASSSTIVKDQATVMPIAFDRDGIAQSQTPGGAGNLTLNGAQVSGGVFTATHLGGWLLSFYSAGNDAGRTFTITGVNAATGGADTEAVVGPNAAHVVSAKYWSSVSQIAVDAACAAAIEVGFHFPLINVAATARGCLVNIINAISSLYSVGAKSLPVLAVNIPSALWAQNRGFAYHVLMTFATGGGGNKNPVLKLGTTTVRDSGAANAGTANPYSIAGTIFRKASGSQRVTWEQMWDGLLNLRGVATPSESEASGITIKIFLSVNEDTAGVGQLESFTLDMKNTP